MEPGPWQTISEDEALQRSSPKALRNLPFRAVKNTGTNHASSTHIGKNGKPKLKKYTKYYLGSDVGGDPFDTYSSRLEMLPKEPGLVNLRKRMSKIPLPDGVQSADIERLIIYAKNANAKGLKTVYPSIRLLNMLASFENREMRSKPLRETMLDALEYLRKVLNLPGEVEAQKKLHGLEKVRKPRLDNIPPNISNRTWGDAMLTGLLSMEDYIDALRAHDAFRRALTHKKQQERGDCPEETEELYGEEITVELALPGAEPPREKRKAAEIEIENTSSSSKRAKSTTASASASSTARAQPKATQVSDSKDPTELWCSKGCDRMASAKCPQKACASCCTGPCRKHRK